jgi:hypothetical protein
VHIFYFNLLFVWNSLKFILASSFISFFYKLWNFFPLKNWLSFYFWILSLFYEKSNEVFYVNDYLSIFAGLSSIIFVLLRYDDMKVFERVISLEWFKLLNLLQIVSILTFQFYNFEFSFSGDILFLNICLFLWIFIRLFCWVLDLN